MIRHRIIVGGHGYSHKWLNTISEAEEKDEIEKIKGFLDMAGFEKNQRVLCNPTAAIMNH